MAYLGQNNDDFDFALENDVTFNGVETEVPWWKQLWAGTKEVLTTGAEVFEKVAPTVFGRPSVPKLPQTQIDPRTGRQRIVYDTPYYPGQRIPSGTIVVTLPSGQKMLRRTQRAGIMPEWGMPLLLLGGGMLLMMGMGKPKKK